jgi:acyl carrier protein
MKDAPATAERVKRLLVASLSLDGLRPESIGDDQPLFGEGLGLDSVDALELVVAMEKEFGISIASHEIGRESFASARALAALVERCRAAATASAGSGAGASGA